MNKAALLYRIEERLREAYGQPRHGNRSNTLDELIFIVLSRQTDESTFTREFAELRRSYWPWKKLLNADAGMLEQLLRPCGFGATRATQLKKIVARLRHDFGRVTLAPLRRMEPGVAEAYLTSLPGVGKKTARCVLMYSLAESVFPVDVHCFRVLRRIGVFDLEPPVRKHEDAIQSMIPEEIRHSLHVTLLSLGRDVCHARKPGCAGCAVESLCEKRGLPVSV